MQIYKVFFLNADGVEREIGKVDSVYDVKRKK